LWPTANARLHPTDRRRRRYRLPGAGAEHFGAASIELANGHTIRSDFPAIRVTAVGGQWGPKTITAEGRLNNGGPLLKISTMTGDINFRSSQ